MTISIAAKRNHRLVFVALAAGTAVLGLTGFTARSAFASPTRTSHFLTPHRSLQVLQTAFGTVVERPIREGRVVVVPTSTAISALSDEVNIRNHAYNPRTGRLWSQGDTDGAWPLGIRGFTDVATGDVYINGEVAIETTTPHEMLHANVAPDFPEAVGLSLYEGATEQLALDALAASHRPLPKLAEYPKERALVAAVVHRVGRAQLARAYLNGGQDLAELVRAIGPETLETAKGDAASGNVGAALAVLQTAGSGR